MSIVSINSNYSNVSDFVNSLFSDGVRSLTPINDAISKNLFQAPFSDQNDKIKKVLIAAWQDSQNDPYNSTDFQHCPSLDKPIMAFLANYIKQNALQISIPILQFQNSISDGPVYKLCSYETHAFIDSSGNWDYTVVGEFLDMLINGAHFVNIQSSFCLPNGPSIEDLWQTFQSDSSIKSNERADTSGIGRTAEVGNSHYANVTNKNGYYYPSVTEDTAPNPSSFILSLLVCITTASGKKTKPTFESFLQLEGWQLPPDLHKIPNSRHDADYNLYKECYWNISTYGASVYSEKRGTAVFLAPSDWIPKPTPNTFMPPYAGAETPQNWLQTNLITM